MISWLNNVAMICRSLPQIPLTHFAEFAYNSRDSSKNHFLSTSPPCPNHSTLVKSSSILIFFPSKFGVWSASHDHIVPTINNVLVSNPTASAKRLSELRRPMVHLVPRPWELMDRHSSRLRSLPKIGPLDPPSH